VSDEVRACAVVPTFDNARTVRAAVQAVAAHLPDIILVDDGSGAEGRAACAAVAADGLATLLRLDRNRGKGAAVKAGLHEAHDRGFTHVLQVDADGQHDLRQIPAFLKAGAEQPAALVLAYPVHDETAPRSRVVLRRFTTLWIGLELGRRDLVVDAMTGFRLYPVAAALAAQARGSRMDFDIEIVVRMARAGVPVVNLPVGVRYPSPEEGGVSHFRPVGDNLRFCWLHSRLCTTGVLGWTWRAVGGRRA
jgi:glycosyltransferase involved in cell wall biosynthesis